MDFIISKTVFVLIMTDSLFIRFFHSFLEAIWKHDFLLNFIEKKERKFSNISGGNWICTEQETSLL